MNYETLIGNFASIIYEALPFIVLGVIIAGLLEEFVPQQAIAKIIPGNRVLAIMLGALLGIIFPMCECGIIVVMRRLLRKGLPLSVCVSYVLCGPVINVVVLTSTYVAFNFPDEKTWILGGPLGVAALRAGLAYIVAVVTAVVVERAFRKHGNRLLSPLVTRGLRNPNDSDDNNDKEQAKRTWLDRLNNITQTALNDFVDIMAFLVLGAALAVGGRLILSGSNFERMIEDNVAVAILLMMGIAILFCLCSEADAFVASNFAPIWPPASKLAFLVLGPMLDIKLYLMYTRVFRTRLIFTIITCVVLQVFVYCMIVHYFAQLTGVFTPVSAPSQ
ncbi:MAG: permease [Planctomycetes bacterium]|nr:permease [Planctomycetota bacterium]